MHLQSADKWTPKLKKQNLDWLVKMWWIWGCVFNWLESGREHQGDEKQLVGRVIEACEEGYPMSWYLGFLTCKRGDNHSLYFRVVLLKLNCLIL